MRNLAISLLVLAGTTLGGALPASANATAGLAAKPAIASETLAHKAHWRHHGFGGFYFGTGYQGYYGYPRYRYYDDYAYRPRVHSYYSYAPRYRHRHWCGRHDRWEY